MTIKEEIEKFLVDAFRLDSGTIYAEANLIGVQRYGWLTYRFNRIDVFCPKTNESLELRETWAKIVPFVKKIQDETGIIWVFEICLPGFVGRVVMQGDCKLVSVSRGKIMDYRMEIETNIKLFEFEGDERVMLRALVEHKLVN